MRNYKVLVALGLGLVVLGICVVLFGPRVLDQLNRRRARAVLEAIPLPATTEVLEVERYSPFLYVYAMGDASLADALRTLPDYAHWNLAASTIAMEHMQASYPGWFNPGYASKAPVCLLSSDGLTEIWAFEDGTLFVRVRIKSGPVDSVMIPASPP